ncbi:protein NDNF-like isoform X2 [Littorina saxatilis]|uniref:Protein NDNF n=2 Tax=Littorina saxatilis TaxID=31220 RepID=A0AAN9BV08_9CAEN
MPALDTRGVLVALVNLIVLCVLRTRTQDLPPPPHRDPFVYQGHHTDTFQVSHQLPDGVEMKSYLFKNRPQTFFFLLDKSPIPLELSVTPCASPIVWSLERKPLPQEDFYDEHRVDPFLEFQSSLETPVTLGNWSEERRRTYRDPTASAGLYSITITSTRSDSTVRILATTTGATHPVYPALPADRKVRVLGTARRNVTFAWPDAAGAIVARPIEYCIAVTRVRNFRTYCSFMSHTVGDEKPVLSKKDQWGFSWEKEKHKQLRRKANPVEPMLARKIVSQQCVGSNREFTFKGRRGKTYYMDVYAIDKETNKSEAYEGAEVKLPEKRSKKMQIVDGGRMTLKLKQDNVPQMVTFEAKERMPLLSVEFGVCAGKIPFEILHNKKLVHRSIVRRWKRVRMKNVLPGNYTFRFPRLKRRKAFVSMHVTSRPSLLTLPRDMSINVYQPMTTCTNITVAWMGTHKKQKYCLYVKELSEIRSLKRHRCSSANDRPKSERVLCMRYRNRDVNKALMKSTITGLKPRTTYVVDVYLSRGRSGPVAYKSVNVRTKGGRC